MVLTNEKNTGIILPVLMSKRKRNENSDDLERYRSGHNEAVLKTVCPQGRVGSNPTLSALVDSSNKYSPLHFK